MYIRFRSGSCYTEPTPIYGQEAVTFEYQNNVVNTTVAAGDIVADAQNLANKMLRRVNIQKYTANFTTGDTGIATAGNANPAYNAQQNTADIDTEAEVFSISNIVLHIEA